MKRTQKKITTETTENKQQAQDFIPYGRQWITDDDAAAVSAVLRSDFLTQGPQIELFEHALSEYTGAQHTVAFNSGTAALHAAYAALGVGAGDEVITTAMTFAATANAALYVGAKPVFCDIDPTTGCLNPELLESHIGPNTKVIATVDYAGQPSALEEIYRIAKRHSLAVVEDACHALGATYKNSKIGDGSYADITIFSFHPVKHITTGEGGALQTNSTDLFQKAAQFRSHGITKDPTQFQNENDGPWYYEMQFLGFNYRMTDIQAALGTSQLKRADRMLQRRFAIVQQYAQAFRDQRFFEIPPVVADTVHAYHLYPIRLSAQLAKRKKELSQRLSALGVGTQVHYLPVYQHPYYQSLGYPAGLCPVAEQFYTEELSLPMFASMTDAAVHKVATTLLRVCGELER